ncbi:MFS transporter [Labrenzia sp. PHM005]|uniref:MFS transporter n=1 Tax=Labrenzia sp. PHM005 TaxID=2590016 RepID=UPI0011400905|nr:MFS transporter [Labrenzia sp. PHM005]QDG74885.1 MFS transporter [Labrenzia sp. PHM005]
MLQRSVPHTREMTRAAIAVLVFCAAMNFFSRGVSETFAVFLLPVTSDLGWSRSTYGTIYFAYMATIGLSAPLIGMIFDRFGPRPVYTAGVCLFGAGFLLASFMEALWQAILGLGIMTGIGISATGMTVASGLVSRWFERRITLANALAYTGIPAGMVVIVPLTQILIEATDWRTAYGVLGYASLAMVPVIWLLPWRAMGTGADHIQSRKTPRSFGLSPAILRHPAFWGLFATLFLASVTVWSVMLQAVAYFVAVGFSPIVAASAYGAVGAMSVVGLVSFGWASDRFGQRNSVTVGYILSALGVAMLWHLQEERSLVTLVGFVVVFGAAMGSRGPAVSALVARLYPENVAAIYGATTIGLGLGGAFGGWLSGVLYDHTGDYGAGFALSIATSLIGITLFWCIKPLSVGRWTERDQIGETQ